MGSNKYLRLCLKTIDLRWSSECERSTGPAVQRKESEVLLTSRCLGRAVSRYTTCRSQYSQKVYKCVREPALGVSAERR
jgi:hypothetical protein